MLHENLLQYRKMLRLSQEEIAERIGVSRQAYAKWEAGTTTPELKYCRMLADLFEITLDALETRIARDWGKMKFGLVLDCAEAAGQAVWAYLESLGLSPAEVIASCLFPTTQHAMADQLNMARC